MRPMVEPVVLSDTGREVLCGWSRRRKTAQALVIRSRIVLACADGGSNTEIARAVVSRIWRAFGLKPHIIETWKGTAPGSVDS